MSMEHNYREFMRQQRAGNRGSGRDTLRALGLISLAASAAFWFPLQWDLVGPLTWRDSAIALAFGTFLVLGPPVFISFFVPWSPAAQLLARINMKTLGQVVALGCSLYLLYYSGQILYAWWSARPAVAASGLATQQMLIGIIATIIAPALLWAPVSSDELEEILKQDQMVKHYELQVQADIAYLQAVLLDAQRAAAIGLTAAAKEQGDANLAWRMQWLVGAIDQTIGEIAHTVKKTSGTIAAFPQLGKDPKVIEVLDHIGNNVGGIAGMAPGVLVLEGTTSPEPPAQPPARTPGAPARPPAPPAHPQAATGSPRASESAGSAGNWREAYATARKHLSGAWKRVELEQALSIRETQAGDYIRAWEQAGLVERLTEPKWHYRWTEGTVLE
jgi:hypothetical protein